LTSNAIKRGSELRTGKALVQAAGPSSAPMVAEVNLRSEQVAEQKARAPSRKSIDQRNRIMDAAFECFSTFGYDSASTREIAKRAGASHTKVLYHFSSKENLWIATMETAISNYINRMETDLNDAPKISSSESLRIFIRDFVLFSAQYPGVHRILSMESTQGSDRLDWLIERYIRKHFNTVRDLIRLGQIEGEVRDGDPVRLYYLIISAGAAPFTLSWEYRALTGRDVFSEAEVYQTIGFIYSVIFSHSDETTKKA
jgi:TetR/AcrR family transcriptional regulator